MHVHLDRVAKDQFEQPLGWANRFAGRTGHRVHCPAGADKPARLDVLDRDVEVVLLRAPQPDDDFEDELELFEPQLEPPLRETRHLADDLVDVATTPALLAWRRPR